MTENIVKMKSYDERAAIERGEKIYQIVNRLANPPSKAEMEKIQQYIDWGANLEVRYNDGNKETLLHIAITREYTDVALLLLKNGADMNARCVQDITPFIWAAMKGNIDVLSAMFDSGKAPAPDSFDYDAFGEGRMTALMCAARSGHKETAFELIRQGADIHLKNDAGRSAYDFATEKNIPLALDMNALHSQLAGRREAERLKNGTEKTLQPMRPLRLKRAP
jgi:ankyrin repeat protein